MCTGAQREWSQGTPWTPLLLGPGVGDFPGHQHGQRVGKSEGICPLGMSNLQVHMRLSRVSAEEEEKGAATAEVRGNSLGMMGVGRAGHSSLRC